MRIVVITTPDQLDQDWIDRLAGEADTHRLEKVAVLAPGVELVQQTRPDVVIVDRALAEAEQCIRQIYASLPSVICIALVGQLDVGALRRLMNAGARDVLAKPLRYAELISSARAAVAVEGARRTRGLPGATDEAAPYGQGKLTVVISPKGGAGTTFVASNLAVMLRQLGSGRVALADFSLQFGHVGTHLNLWSKHTLGDLIERCDEIDDALLAGVMQQHTSGVHVLLAPSSPELAGDIAPEQLDLVLDGLLARYSYVVADTWCVLDELTMALLRRAGNVLVVTTPEVPALKNVKYFLDFLRQHQLTGAQVSIVLNRFPSVDGITLEDVQQHLRHPISANIPSAGPLVAYSVNRGVPVVTSHPQSWVAQSLRKLAAYIAGEQVDLLSVAPADGKGRKGAAKEPGARRGLLPAFKR